MPIITSEEKFEHPLTPEVRDKLEHIKREIVDEIVSIYTQYNLPNDLTYSVSIDKERSNDGFKEFYVLKFYNNFGGHRHYLFDTTSKKLIVKYLGVNNKDNVVLELNNPSRFEENVSYVYETYNSSETFLRNRASLKESLQLEEIELYTSGG